MFNLEYLEYHVIHGCNLKCQGCSHFSHVLKGGLKTGDNLTEELEPWTKRINIESFCLMGGEPLLNPNIKSLIEISRNLLPYSKINITTNGLLLENNFIDFDLLQKNKISLIVSLHSYSKIYLEKFNLIKLKLDEWKNLGLDITIRNSVQNWTKRYNEVDGQILPYYDNNPKESYEICMSKKCKQLHQGRLWKCPTSAYSKLLDSFQEWDLMKNYHGISVECTEEELLCFLEKKEENICSHCPNVLLSCQKF